MPGLSGCIVVRNGKNSILRCMDALLPLVNEYVVVDTGSTDGTVELIFSWCKRHPHSHVIMESVGRRFHDDDGIFDFGAAKNYAFSKATMPYVMWVDCNDIVQNGAEVRKAFEKIVKKIPHAGISLMTRVDPEFRFPRMRIAPKEYAHMVGSIHEYLENTAPDKQLVTTRFEINNFKKVRDVSRNVKALDKEWRKKHTQRTAFYLGNSYRDMRLLDEAIMWYSIALDEFPDVKSESRIKSLETVCELCTSRRYLDQLAVRSLQMIEELPASPEGYYYRAMYNNFVHDTAKELKCLMMVMKLNTHTPYTNMWINPIVYDRKVIGNMIAESRERLKYTNLQPMVPDHIEDVGNSRYMMNGNMNSSQMFTPLQYDQYGM